MTGQIQQHLMQANADEIRRAAEVHRQSGRPQRSHRHLMAIVAAVAAVAGHPA
jgi:hypothetical protein